jgi:hypothetical protein
MCPVPFVRPSLSERSANRSSIRAFTFLFDTDAYHTKTFAKIIAETNIHDVLSDEALEQLEQTFAPSLKDIFV